MGRMSNWVAFAALVLAFLVVGLDVTVLNVALPTLAAKLQADTRQLQWIVDAYVLALAGAMLPAGVLGDRFGRKKLLVAGLVIFLLGSLGATRTDSITPLIALRAMIGLGAAIIFSIGLALIPVMFDDQDRPKAVGAAAAAGSLGMPLGLIVGGYLLKHYAWHSIFWINVPVSLVALVAVLALIGESRAPTRPPLDLAGAVLAVGGIVALVYGLVEAPRRGWTSITTLAFVAAGVVLLIGFVVWEARTSAPLVDLTLFRDHRFAGGTVAIALLTFVLYGLLFTLPLYLQAVRGNDALGTGVRLIPMMAGLLVAAAASKRLLTKIGATRGTVTGTLIVAAALAALSRITIDTSMIWIGAGLTVFGLGAGIAFTSALDAVLGALPETETGAGSGVYNTLRQIAGALGVAILGSVLSSIYRDRLDDAMLQQLSPESASAVRDSIVGAVQVAHQLGDGGQALSRMAGAGYTDAMSVILIISAVAGVVAAVISGLALRGRPVTIAGGRRARIAAQES